MAKLRRRFYVARYSNGGRAVISAKYHHNQRMIDSSSVPLTSIEGPFRTFDDACIALSAANETIARAFDLAERNLARVGFDAVEVENLLDFFVRRA